MSRFLHGSMDPPVHARGAVVNDLPPKSCILDRVAYIADIINASTAHYTTITESGRIITIQITFVLAHPPAVSFFCAYCFGSKFNLEPRIITTQGSLALFSIKYGLQGPHSFSHPHDYYIYQATPKPSLTRLPNPNPIPCSEHRFFDGKHLGLLPVAGTNHHQGLRSYGHQTEHGLFYVAGVFSKESAPGQFDLYLFSSRTQTWSIEQPPLLLDQQQRQDGHFEHVTTKVVSVGGERGSMCFVDLWRGILQCYLLDDRPVLRYVRLPPPLDPNMTLHDLPFVVRDIAVIRGRFKFVELLPDSTWSKDKQGYPVLIFHGWKAVTWNTSSTNLSASGEVWCQDKEVNAYEVSSNSNPVHLELLPKLPDDGQVTALTTLERLDICLPALSLHDDNVVYFMTKVNQFEKDAWMIGIDMTNKAIRGVAQFLPGRIVQYTYVESMISNYLNMHPGTSGNLKRPGTQLLESSCKRQSVSSMMLHSSMQFCDGIQQQEDTNFMGGEDCDNMVLDPPSPNEGPE